MTKLTLVLLLIGALSFVSCRKVTIEDQTNELTQTLNDYISSFDPAKSYDTVSGRIVYQCYETLFEYHYLKRPYSIQPLMAEAMPSISPDGLTVTIKIKKNIRYHDDPAFQGKIRFVKAQDFITQIKRLAFKPLSAKGWFLFDNKIIGINKYRKTVGSSFEKFKNTSIQGISAPDDHTLQFKLIAPHPKLINALAMSFTVPIPMEVVEHYKNNLNDRIIGTGPFFLEKYIKKQEVQLKKFKHYRKTYYPSTGDRYANSNHLLKDSGKQIPFIDKVTFKIILNTNERWLRFVSGEFDFLRMPIKNFGQAFTSQGQLSKELLDKGISYHIVPTLTFWWLSFNLKDRLIGNNRYLRLAIAHAIDINKYIRLFTNNVAQKANSIYLPGIYGYSPSRQLPYEYDLLKAKKFLKKAGYPKGKNLATITLDTRVTNQLSIQTAKFLKIELKKIGINLKIVKNTFPEFLAKKQKGALQFWRGGWGLDYPDAENIVELLITKNFPPGPNSSYYSNVELDEIYEKMKLIQNGPEKLKYINRIEEIVNYDVPWIMSHYSRYYMVTQKRLLNLRASDLIQNYMKYLRVSGK